MASGVTPDQLVGQTVRGATGPGLKCENHAVIAEAVDSRGAHLRFSSDLFLGERERLLTLEVRGWLKKFQEGWGFMNSDAFTGDLFVHARENPEIAKSPRAVSQTCFSVHRRYSLIHS